MHTNAIYLKKLLTDAGYDQHSVEGDWIIGYSSYYGHNVAVLNSEAVVLALPEMVAMQLNTHEQGGFVPLVDAPEGFPMGMALDMGSLLSWLKKSIKLSPEEPKGIIKTDVQGLVRQRRGQEKLRNDLMKYWGGKCAVTDISTEELLVASHIKPWSECENSTEKLDLYNALLLNVALDRVFDQGFITFDDNGRIKISLHWSLKEAKLLGINESMYLRYIDDKHCRYLAFHRKNVWKK